MECLITSVNYDDLLAITLPTVMREIGGAVIITTREDSATVDVARRHGARVYRTRAFHRNGAAFNKAAALNELVSDEREWDYPDVDLDGWVMTLDADIYLPEGFGGVMQRELERGCLHGAHRLMCPDLATWRAGGPFPPIPSPPQLPGFLHVFWAPPVEEPWYDDSFEHAGAYDTAFQNRWPKERRRRFSMPVIHLGRLGQNWFGRRTARWSGESTGGPDAEAVERVWRQHQALKAAGVPGRERRRAQLLK